MNECPNQVVGLKRSPPVFSLNQTFINPLKGGKAESTLLNQHLFVMLAHPEDRAQNCGVEARYTTTGP
ncbi:hypothetical protein TNCV_1849961 [Trichonephila clavipes]|nr:hypothetical protein TNCV_1849961 [Trichonephila clavipes]